MSDQRYQAKGKIGQGGLGEVYLAQDTQLDREVALKRVKMPEDGNVEALSADLIREAKTLSALQHPNIVTVYDVGKDEKGPFVVLELLKGETLDAVIDRGGMTLDDFKQVVVQTLEGLIAAQAVGLVHRDLKPGNIMVVWLASGKFQIKILDFGLAKFGLKARPQTEDQGGGIFGSIFFMAPEQFERFPLDARTDMYSLGCIYYQILSTKHPFGGETGVEVMASHLQHHVTPLKQIRPDLPDWLCHWVMWLISREMDDRPADARMALEYFMAQRHGIKGVTQPATGVVRPGAVVGGNPNVRGGPPTRQIGRPHGGVLPVSGSVSQPITGQGTIATSRSSMATMQKVPKKKSNAAMWVILSVLTVGLLGGGAYLFFASSQPPKETVATTNPAPSIEAVKAEAKVTPPTAVSPMATTETSPEAPKPTPAAVAPPKPKPPTKPVAKKVDPADMINVKAKSVLTQLLSGDEAAVTAARNAMPELPGEAKQATRTKILTAALAQVKSKEERTKLLQVIGGEQLLDSSSLLRGALTSEDPSERLSAIEAIPAWGPKSSVANALLSSVGKGETAELLDAYCKLISRNGSDAESRVADLKKVIPHATSPSVRESLLAALSSVAHLSAKIIAIELNDDATTKAIDAAISKRHIIGAADQPLSADSAYVMGVPNGATYDAASRTITNWNNENTWIGWDLEIGESRKIAVQISVANSGAKDAYYRIILGNFTKPIKVPQTGSDSQFVLTEPIELMVPKPGNYRMVVVPSKLPTGQNLMNVRGAVILKK